MNKAEIKMRIEDALGSVILIVMFLLAFFIVVPMIFLAKILDFWRGEEN